LCSHGSIIPDVARIVACAERAAWEGALDTAAGVVSATLPHRAVGPEGKADGLLGVLRLQEQLVSGGDGERGSQEGAS
jgi:hypothetical protein